MVKLKRTVVCYQGCLPVNWQLTTAHCLSGPASIWYRLLWYRESRQKSVAEADIEQHPFRNLSHHFLRFEVDYKQRLLALEFSRVGALLFDSRENAPRVIAEVDYE